MRLAFIAAFVGSGLGIYFLAESFYRDRQLKGRGGSLRDQLGVVRARLLDWTECFDAGLVPKPGDWDAMGSLPAPWGGLIFSSLRQLRESGGAVLPTLRRFRALVEEQLQALRDGDARASTAKAQVQASLALIPIAACGLYYLLPNLQQEARLWTIASGFALAFASIAWWWMARMIEVVRWGGLARNERSWGLFANGLAERILASVRSGTPPDLAWVEAVRWLSESDADLARHWQMSVFAPQIFQSDLLKLNPRSLSRSGAGVIRFGEELRQAIQLSLLEGRSSLERLESVIDSFRREMRAQLDRELGTLATHALKPLFIFVAPSLLGLLAFAFFLTAAESL